VTTDEVTSIRERLWGAGYRPVPVFSFNHGAENEKGKRPLSKAWTGLARKDPPDCLERDVVAYAMNTGILCDGLYPFDLDINHRDLAAECRALILERLGADALIRHRSNSGRCLILYRAAIGAPKKVSIAGKLGKIEVLGEGNQFVAHGIHATKATLEWSPHPPWEMTAKTSLP
jgi:hypothetical protein